MRADYYTAHDMAAFCGLSHDGFLRTRDKLIARGMPAPFKDFGQLRFDRARVDAWRKGVVAKRPANDVLPGGDPIDAARARLAAAYGGR